MDTKKILQELHQERSHIERAITALEAIADNHVVYARSYDPAAEKPKWRGRHWSQTAAGHKRMSKLMRARWAARRAKAAKI